MNGKRLIMVVLAGMLMACGLGYSQNNNKIGKRIDGELIDAVSALDEGQYKEAQVTLERILTADPRNDAAQYYLGMCRLYANDLDGAKTAFKKAAELDPSNFWYKERLARTYSLTGEDDLTIATYEALLKDFPKRTTSTSLWSISTSSRTSTTKPLAHWIRLSLSSARARM